ncbi:MAG: hypothetical protein M1484_02100 [Patescibacteria group bacterium]|nr:hypothetical protein [Patescibacteria group bacterium]MCL5431873.1 hypothetical protein [Patescibacteria group bacterium]
MIDWVKEGEKILSRSNLSAQERTLMEAHLGTVRLSAQALAERRHENVVKALKSEPYNPNVVTDFWQSLLTATDIVQCPYSLTELRGLAKKERGPVYIPNFTYPELGQKFPHLSSWAVAKGSTIKDERETAGWTDIEIVLEAPYRNTTERQLQERFANEGRVGARLKVGVLASEASKLLTDHYLDEGPTWSRYLGSRHVGQVVYACFGSDGGLHVHSYLEPGDVLQDIGGRSEGVR